MRTKSIAFRKKASPQEVRERFEKAQKEEDGSGSSQINKEEEEDLSKAIVSVAEPEPVPVPIVSENFKKFAKACAAEASVGRKDLDDLLNWVRDLYGSTVVPEEDSSSSDSTGESTEKFSEQEKEVQEERPSTEEIQVPLSSAEQEAAEALESIFHTDPPAEGDDEQEKVATSSATSESSHSSDNVPLKMKLGKVSGKGKPAAPAAKKKKKCVKTAKRKSFSDPEESPRPKRKCTETSKGKEKVPQKTDKGKKPVKSQSKKKEVLSGEGKRKSTNLVIDDTVGERMRDEAARKKLKRVEKRGVVAERVIHEAAFHKFGLTDLLKERGMFKAVTFAEGYSLAVVQEFYSNLLPSDQGITRVYVRGKWIPFTPATVNRFLEFKAEVKGNFEEGLEVNEEVLKEITGGRVETWGEETRLPASMLTAKYNVLFRLGVFNWLPAPHNSGIVKELALLIYSIGTGRKFNLGRLIFQNIAKEADSMSSASALGYPALLSHYLLQHGIKFGKEEVVTAVKKLKVSQKLFSPGKKIDLPVGRVSPPPIEEEAEGVEVDYSEGHEKLLKESIHDLERRQKALAAELFIIAQQKQKLTAQLEAVQRRRKASEGKQDRGSRQESEEETEEEDPKEESEEDPEEDSEERGSD